MRPKQEIDGVTTEELGFRRHKQDVSHSAKSFSTAGNEDLIRTTLVGAGLACNLQTRRCSSKRLGVQNLRIKCHEMSLPVWPQSEQTLFISFSRYWGGGGCNIH